MEDALDGEQAWTRYWRTGQQHSCFVAGAPFETATVWSEFFDGAPAGASVLDLACGGGALTRIALGHPKGFSVTGVDFAEALAPVEGAVLMPRVRLEALPFEDGAFGVVISQFGLEYADADDSVAQAARVLAGGGLFGALIHHAEGELARAAEAGRVRLQRLTDADGPVAAAAELGAAMLRGESRPDLVTAIEQALRAESGRQQDQTTAWGLGFLAEIMAKRSLFPPAYLAENAQTLMVELQGFETRIGQMVRAARSENDILKLCDRLETHGLSAHPPTVVRDQGGAAIAWFIRASR
ncbi:MAG: class I SAM-dependent methyltransferase [Alphaproteobacteria bacterium]|nr:class I SAM-dependent methyltransferase [Alphaproteobacteria bacterium]